MYLISNIFKGFNILKSYQIPAKIFGVFIMRNEY